MQAAPTRSSHHCWLRITIARPATAAIAKKISAAISTARGDAFRDAVSRAGPTRWSSVPRMPSL